MSPIDQATILGIQDRKRYRNLGQGWYHTKTKDGKRTSRWRYSKVAHVAEDENSTETYCGLPLENTARTYAEEALVDNGLDYYTSRNVRFCKKCEKHPSFGLLILRIT